MNGVKYSKLAGVIDSVKRMKQDADLNDALDAYDRNMRKVVSVRLDVADIYVLEAIAKEMGVSRTACAQELLETAIMEVAEGLGVQNFSFEMHGDDQGRVTVSADGKTPLVVEDDALIIGGGQEK